jgi:hypothetical protein
VLLYASRWRWGIIFGLDLIRGKREREREKGAGEERKGG